MIVVALALSGAAIGLGMALAIAGAIPGEPAVVSAPRWRVEHIDVVLVRLALAALGAVAVGLLTGWPVAALATGALVLAGPSLLRGDRDRQRVAGRREALASWAEMLRDTLEAGRGLETAIAATAMAAPDPIASDVRLLAAELRTTSTLDRALRRFAARIDDPVADRVVAGLLLRRQDATLGAVLSAVAQNSREDVAIWRRNDIEQGRNRWSARVIVGVTAALALLLAITDRAYLAPYDGPAGQVVLAVIVAAIGAAFWWLSRLAAEPPAARLLVGDVAEGAPW